MNDDMKPAYKHDCEHCHFLGQHTDATGTLYDLYFHPGKFETLIARYASDGPSYTSGSVFGRNAERNGEHDHPLYRALVLARSQRFIVPKTYYLAQSTDYFEAYWDAYEQHPYSVGRPKLLDFVTMAMDDAEHEDAMRRHKKAVEAYDREWRETHGEPPKRPPEGMTELFSTAEEALQWADPIAVVELVADNDEHARELAQAHEQQLVRWYRAQKRSR